KASMFNYAGTFLRSVTVASTTRVERNTAINVASTGPFAVYYTSAGTPMVRHFSSTGVALDPGVASTSTPPPPTPTPTPTPTVTRKREPPQREGRRGSAGPGQRVAGMGQCAAVK